VDYCDGQCSGSGTLGSAPANVSTTLTGGGKVYFGSKGITALAPTNVLEALARDVVFNIGGSHLTSTAIVLGGGVTITADPPPGMAEIQAPQVMASTASGVTVPATAVASPVSVATAMLSTPTAAAGMNLAAGSNVNLAPKTSLPNTPPITTSLHETQT